MTKAARVFSIHRDDAKFLSACSLELGLGCLAFALGIVIGPDPRNRIPSLFDWEGLALGLGIGAVVGGLLAGGMLLVQLIPLEAIRSLNDRSTHQLMQLLRGLSIPQLIAVALTAGVGEELLFRGWLMQFLTGEMANCTQQEIFFGILVSSLVFGFAHPMSVSYVIVATLMGVVLGTLYWYYDNLLVPIVAHWIYDAILMVWLTRMPICLSMSARSR